MSPVILCDISHGKFYLLSRPGQLMLKNEKRNYVHQLIGNPLCFHTSQAIFLWSPSLLVTLSLHLFFFYVFHPLPLVCVLHERERRACTSGPHTFALMMYCPAEEFHLLWLASAEPVASH